MAIQKSCSLRNCSGNNDNNTMPKKLARRNGKKSSVEFRYCNEKYDLSNDESDAEFCIEVLLHKNMMCKQFQNDVDTKIINFVNYPSCWSLGTLAKLFDKIGKVANSKYIASGKITVMALIELGLKMSKNELNMAFKNDGYNNNVTTRGRISSAFTTNFLDLTMGRHYNFCNFYEKVFGKNFGMEIYTNNNNKGSYLTFADVVRLVMSWFASYIILQVYGKIYTVRYTVR